MNADVFMRLFSGVLALGAIVAVALIIIICFRPGGDVPTTKVRAEFLGTEEVWRFSFGRGKYLPYHRLTFHIENGGDLSFDLVSNELHWLEKGDMGTLTYAGKSLVGFEKDSGRQKADDHRYLEE